MQQSVGYIQKYEKFDCKLFHDSLHMNDNDPGVKVGYKIPDFTRV